MTHYDWDALLVPILVGRGAVELEETIASAVRFDRQPVEPIV
jgi:hypothetical protein